MKTKAQIKMMETIAVLLVFFMLAAMGFIFYFSYQNKKIEELKNEMALRDAIKVSQTASLLPELQCSIKNIRQDNCIDTLKLQALKEIMAKEPKIETEHYRELFKYAKISAEQILPETKICTNPSDSSGNECVLYEHSLPKSSSRARTSYPYLIYDPLARYEQANAKEYYYFGKMTVEVYY